MDIQQVCRVSNFLAPAHPPTLYTLESLMPSHLLGPSHPAIAHPCLHPPHSRLPTTPYTSLPAGPPTHPNLWCMYDIIDDYACKNYQNWPDTKPLIEHTASCVRVQFLVMTYIGPYTYMGQPICVAILIWDTYNAVK